MHADLRKVGITGHQNSVEPQPQVWSQRIERRPCGEEVIDELRSARTIVKVDLDLVGTLTSPKNREETDANLHC